MYTSFGTSQVPILLDDPYYDSYTSNPTSYYTYLQMSIFIFFIVCVLYCAFYMETGTK